MNLTRYEQETIVNFNEEESTASVYTHNRALIRKLRQLSEKFPKECCLDKASHDGKAMDYIIPKSWVRIRPGRQLSEQQRVALAERAKANLPPKTPIVVASLEPATVAEGNYIPDKAERKKRHV